MKILSIALSLLVSVAAIHAQAKSKTVSFRGEILEGYQALGLVENKGTEVVYELVEKKVVSKLNIEGQEEVETKTELPRKEKGEFSRVTVQKVSDKKVLILSESLTYVSTQNVGEIKFVEKEELEADITRGTWADLQNNLNVELTLTNRSVKKFNKNSAKHLAEVMQTEMESALENETGLDMTVKVSITSDFKQSPISGTLQRLSLDTRGSLRGSATVRW